MLFKKKYLVLTLLFLILNFAGCTAVPGCNAGEENSEPAQEEKEMPNEIKEIETAALEIMQQADLIPLVEVVSQKSDEDAEAEEEGEDQEVELTFEKTILGEVLKRELEAEDNDEESIQLPGDTEEIWDNIKINATKLHDQWNELEPMVIQENVYTDTINSFEEALDTLTVFVTEQNYFGTLSAANDLTKHLSKIMTPFAENAIPTVNELRYHVRNILLNAAIDNYKEAQESLNYMKEQSLSVTSALEENEERAESLNISLDNLQRALNNQNHGLIKINAAIVMEELIQIMEELE
ncbi:MAG: hypothetical protein Q7J85_09090 [Bacillota bacterium]|nr:hypothetical protein [Bacillota bacterium]